MNIIRSSTCMYLNTSQLSLETECLFGEVVEIFDKHQDWVYCKLDTDNYCGWIKKSDLGFIKRTTHRVIIKRSFIYKNSNAKSEILNLKRRNQVFNLTCEVKSMGNITFKIPMFCIQMGYILVKIHEVFASILSRSF